MNCKTIVEKVDESTEGLEYSGKGKCLGCVGKILNIPIK